MNVNPWYGQPRRHAKAARKGWRKRRHGGGRRRKSAAHRRRCKPCKYRRSRSGQFTGGLTRRELASLDNPHNLANPAALYENAGIMSMSTWASFGTAAVATALGLVVADFVDRIVATRQPADVGGAKAVRPWYGRDAAAAQRMRPDAWRLGAQAAGAVVALGLAFWTRNIKFIPWALGGVALGFASNLVMKVTQWWLMPAIFKIEKSGEQTIANRTYVLEQDKTQTTVQGMFDKWNENPALAAAQAAGDGAVILGPLDQLTADQAQKLVLLGKAQANGKGAPGAVGANGAQFVNTGRKGLCPHCKQVNGCLSNCPTLCPKCPEYRPFVKAKYPVKNGDNLTQLAALGGVTVADVNALNGGGSPETYWKAGNTVFVPYGMAMVLERKSGSVGAPPQTPKTEPEAAPSAPTPNAAPTEVVAQPTVSIQNLGVHAEDAGAE